MAYTQSGKITSSAIIVSEQTKTEYVDDIPNKGYGLAFYKDNGEIPKYVLYAVKLPQATEDTQIYTETWNKYNNNGDITYTSTSKLYLSQPSGHEKYWTSTLSSSGWINNNSYSDIKIKSTIPTFSDLEALYHYLDTGDDSGKDINLKTDWTLYVDGNSNPLYKLTWKCDDLKGIDTGNTTIAIWVGTYNVFDSTFVDDDGTKFKEVFYNKGSVKFSYHDIEQLIPQPPIGHNPVCIRIQLAYRKFETAKVNTSTSMGCDLYYNSEPQGFLFDVLGYLTMSEGLWHITSNGDGSTFTVKDGKEGSDGYTDDNDDGYDDGKDKDDKDDDTGDVSAGIGVLTSTFKMTKERLIQLGQFLWGSNIFDKFSLVNNNHI